MNSSLIIIKNSPYLGRKSHEILEAVMSLALFEVSHRVVFFGDGLLWLTQPQTATHQKSLIKQLQALPLYGSEDIFYCGEHATDLTKTSSLNDVAQPTSVAQLAQWLRESAKVEVF